MKLMPSKIATCALLATLAFSQISYAKTWGLGAVIGSPTGLSANYFMSEARTIHTTLAYDFGGHDRLQIASHYQWRMNNLQFEQVKLGWFYGAGARLAFKDDDHHDKHDHDEDGDVDFGPSGTIGLFHEFEKVPLEVFLKGNLTLNLITDTDVDADVMLGLHYNF